MIRHRDPRREEGQALILVVLSMAAFFAVALLVLDGSHLFVVKRSAQNAADAAALAASWELAGASPTQSGPTAHTYAADNGFPNVDPSNPSGLGSCPDSSSTSSNCYILFGHNYPYKVEVRVREHVSTWFGDVVSALSGGNFSGFDVSAHAVANATGQQHCTLNGVPRDDLLPTCHIDGTPARTGTPVGLSGATAFTMSRACDAILWTGSANGNPTLGSMGTNGGLTFNGADGKRVRSLAYNAGPCAAPPTPPGTPCTATDWGDPSDPATIHSCVKTPVDLSAQVPLNWRVTTTVPALLPSGTAFTPSTDYGVNCVNLGSGNLTFTPSNAYSPPSGGAASGPPGVYCLSGASSVLTVGTGGNHDFEHFGSGEGYTFFTLGGASISVASNSTDVAFYWPSACGARPTGRPPSFSCFSRTITGYDPQIMFYATNPTHSNQCAQDAICINGNSAVLKGDMFAMSPSTFPPPNPTTTGGTIFMAGGAANAGSGFLQSWWLTVQGNNGTYTGTGPDIPIHCTFTGNPPVINPDQYLNTSPPCTIPGTAAQDGTITTTPSGTGLTE